MPRSVYLCEAYTQHTVVSGVEYLGIGSTFWMVSEIFENKFK